MCAVSVKRVTTNQTLLIRLFNYPVEDTLKHIRAVKTTNTILAQRGGIRHFLG